MLLLRKTDERIGLTRVAEAEFADRRVASRIEHSLHSLPAQRIYALCCGYEDLNNMVRNTRRIGIVLAS